MSGLTELAEEFPERRQKRARRGYRRGPKRYCPHGHEYTPENTIIEARRGRKAIRRCRKCRDGMHKAWKKRVGYKYRVLSRIGRADALLRRALNFVHSRSELAADIQEFLQEKRKLVGFAARKKAP